MTNAADLRAQRLLDIIGPGAGKLYRRCLLPAAGPVGGGQPHPGEIP